MTVHAPRLASPRLDRRSFLLTGSLGLGAFAVPGFAQTPNVTRARGFTHAVASGEPAPDSMLLWTRYVPAGGDAVELRAEISETPDFRRIVASGAQITGPWRDHTAKITLDGLKPGMTYHYRFIAPDGTFSAVGRTRTLPEGPVPSFRRRSSPARTCRSASSTLMATPPRATTSISSFTSAIISTNMTATTIRRRRRRLAGVLPSRRASCSTSPIIGCATRATAPTPISSGSTSSSR